PWGRQIHPCLRWKSLLRLRIKSTASAPEPARRRRPSPRSRRNRRPIWTRSPRARRKRRRAWANSTRSRGRGQGTRERGNKEARERGEGRILQWVRPFAFHVPEFRLQQLPRKPPLHLLELK